MARLERAADGMHLRLESPEVDVLGSLSTGLAARLEDGPSTSEDAGLFRLLAPDLSRGDAAIDAELRAMLHPDLLSARAARLRDLDAQLTTWRSDAGDLHAVLDRDAAMRLVEALNDLRLALAATVGLDTIERDDIAEDDERSDALRLMDALAWLQGGLIEFVDHD